MVAKYSFMAGIILCAGIGCTITTTTSSQKGQPKVIDPVCAYFSDMGCVNIAIDENTPKSTYEGETYYFCSKECKVDFDKNPSKYLKAVTFPQGAVDPVCRMEIGKLERFVTCIYHDKVYYFCSDHCRIKYMANPDNYSGKE